MGPFSVFRWLVKTFLELFAVGGFFIHRGYGSTGCFVALLWLPGAICMGVTFMPLPTVQQFTHERLGVFILGFVLLTIAGAVNAQRRQRETQSHDSFGGRHPPGGSP